MNRILAERRAAITGQDAKPETAGWEHDIRGDVFVGFVIGFVTYMGGTPDVPIAKILVAAVIGGVSGATYFTKTKEVQEARRQVRRESAKSKTLKKATDLALETPIKEEGGNGRESPNL